MGRLFLAMALVGVTAVAADLQKVEATTDGFCVQEVLRLQRERDRVPLEQMGLIPFMKYKVALQKAISAAKQTYRTYGGYTPEAEIYVRKAETVRTTKGTAGHVVELDQRGDEDLITFYFTVENRGSAKLKLALHDDQSSTAYWICE